MSVKYSVIVPAYRQRDPANDVYEELPKMYGEGTYRSIKTYAYTEMPKREVFVELFVDFEAIARRLGVKAAGSKSRKSKALSGAVVVKLAKGP